MLFFSLLISFSLQAKVILDEVSTTEKARFALKSVCQKMVTHETPLIEVLSGTEIDCMGKKVSVRDFCEKEMVQDPYYLRAYVDQKAKEVVCLSGKKVMFKYRCGPLSDKALCGDDAKKACAIIKDKLAKRLDLVHASYVKNKQLNCFFESLPLNER